MQTITRTPPHNLEAERSVLGSIFKDNKLIGGLTLLPAEFFHPGHKIIYMGMLALYREEKKIDPISISEKLKKHKFLAKIGGMEYLEKLKDSISTVDPLAVGQHVVLVKEKALLRKLIKTGYGVVQEGYNAIKAPEDILQGLRDDALQLGQALVAEEFVLQDALTKVWEELEEYTKDPTVRISTGFADLDKITGGYKKKRVYMIGGLPNMGKTSFLIEETNSLLDQGKKVVYVTLEMSNNEILLRMLNRTAKIPTDKLENPTKFDSEDWNKVATAIGGFSKKSLIVNDSAETVAQIVPLVEKYTPDVLVIDFIDNMPFPLGGTPTEISRAVIDFKKIAKRLNIVVLIASQINRLREGYSKETYQLKDLKGSGGKETGADIVMFVIWPWKDRVGKTNPSTGKEWLYPQDARTFWVVVKKNKFGRTGQCRLFFNDEYGLFKGWSNREEGVQ